MDHVQHVHVDEVKLNIEYNENREIRGFLLLRRLYSNLLYSR